MEEFNLEDFYGSLITAIDPCYMDENKNHPTLTVGKEYEIVDANSERGRIVVVDDEGDEHIFEVTKDGKFVSWHCSVAGKVVTPFEPLKYN